MAITYERQVRYDASKTPHTPHIFSTVLLVNMESSTQVNQNMLSNTLPAYKGGNFVNYALLINLTCE
jgi:hypothetical protein